jgi:hypothetical protein
MPRGIGRKFAAVVLVLILLWMGSLALGYAGPTEIVGEWELAQAMVANENGPLVEDVLVDHEVTVEFDGGEVVMTGPCNSQTPPFFRVGDRLVSVPGFRTSRLCHWEGVTSREIDRVDEIAHRPARWLSRVVFEANPRTFTWTRGDVVLSFVEATLEDDS